VADLTIWRRLFVELCETLDGSEVPLLDEEGARNLNAVIDILESKFKLEQLGPAMWDAPGVAAITAFYARTFRHRTNQQKDILDETAAVFYVGEKKVLNVTGKVPSDRSIDEQVKTHGPYVQHKRWHVRLTHYASKLGELHELMTVRCRLLEQLSNNYRQERRIEEEMA